MNNDAVSGRLAVLLGWFAMLYPYFIYPMDQTYYYANTKAYYLIGFAWLLWTVQWFRTEPVRCTLSNVKPAEWLLLSWLLLAGFSTLQGIRLSLIGYQTEHQGVAVLLAYVVLYWAASRWISRSMQQKLVRWIVLSSTVPALYGIAQHFGMKLLPQDALPEAHLPQYHFELRSWSLFDNPDYFGAYLVMMFILALTCYLTAHKRLDVLLYAAVIGILCTALLYSSTRSAWVGAAAGVITLVAVFAQSRDRRRQWKRWSLFAVTCCLLLVVLAQASDTDFVSRAATIPADIKKLIDQPDDGSAGASRWYIWRTTVPLVKDYFWLGSGPNTFGQLFHPGIAADYFAYIRHPVYDANNDYVQIALTMGIPALLAYLLFLVVVLYTGVRAARHAEREPYNMLSGLLAAAIGYCVQALFNISVVSVAPYFWIIMGFIAAHDIRSTQQGQ